MMKNIIIFFVSLLVFAITPASAGMMARNDFRFGSAGFKQDTFSIYMPLAYKFISGISGTFYKSNDFDKIHSAKIPLSYTGETNLIEFEPFIYSHLHGMTAYGGKLSLSTTLTAPENPDYFHLSISGGHAFIKGEKAAEGLSEFQQTAITLKAEKNFYGQFSFNLSGTGFLKPSENTDNTNLTGSVLDFKDLADFNGYEMLRILPEWIISARIHRNFQPEFDSGAYAGYSKISLRNLKPANSYTAGIEFFLNGDTTLDFGYNYFKYHETSANQYFRLLLSTMF